MTVEEQLIERLRQELAEIVAATENVLRFWKRSADDDQSAEAVAKLEALMAKAREGAPK